MNVNPSLYERIGGENAIMAAVDLFYKKVIADPLTKPFFESLDMTVLAQKQVSFMATAFGGPAQYRGRDLREAHKPLVARGLNDSHFDAVAKHLQSTLQELSIGEDLIKEVLSVVETTRANVLDR